MRVRQQGDKKFNGNPPAPRFAALALLAFWVMMYPSAARAQMAVIDTTAIGDFLERNAVDAGRWVQTQAEWVTDHLQSAAASSSNIAGQQTLAEANLKGSQAITDQIQRSVNMNGTAQIAKDQVNLGSPTTPISTATAPGTLSCRTATTAQAKENVEHGATGLKGALKLASLPKRIGKGPDVAAKELMDGCTHGFRGSTSPYGTTKLKQMGCNDPQSTMKYIDADLKISSVLDYEQYSLPAGTTYGCPLVGDANGNLAPAASCTTDQKVITFPSIDKLQNDDERRYVAAMAFCDHLKPYQPTPPGGTARATLEDVRKLDDDLNLAAQVDAAYDSCVGAVANRTAISQAVASSLTKSGAGGFQDLYNAQIAMCTALTNEKILTNSTYTLSSSTTPMNCTTTGISKIMVDYIKAHKYTYLNTNYPAFLEEHGITPENLMMLTVSDGDKILADYAADRRAEKAELVAGMQSVLALEGKGEEVDPTAKPLTASAASRRMPVSYIQY